MWRAARRGKVQTMFAGRGNVTLIVSLCCALSGCGQSLPATTSDGEPIVELRFTVPDDVDFLDPQGTSWMKDFRIIECLFEPLVRIDPATMRIEPAAADHWTISDDGLVYTFHIRDDARWSNGDPVTAGDFIYGWKRALLPDFAADYSVLLFNIKGGRAFFDWRAEQLEQFAGIRSSVGGGAGASAMDAAEALRGLTDDKFRELVGLRAIDEKTLEVTLERPTAYFMEVCAFATLMPVHEASEAPTIELNPETGRLEKDATYFSNPSSVVSNGAYVLTQWKFKQRMVLDQNPHYWNKAGMNNQRIVQEVVGDFTTALLKFYQGEVDWVPGVPTSTTVGADLYSSGDPNVHTIASAGTYFYLFNCRPMVNGKPNPLADVRVRRALSMGIDRKTLVDQVMRGGQPVAYTFVPPGAIPGYDAPVGAGVRFDPEAGRQLLAEAGYPDGKGLNGLSILYNSEGGHQWIAQAIARMWDTHLGVTVTLEAVEVNRFRQLRHSGDFTISRSGWFGDYRDPTTFLDMFRTGDGNNDGDFSDPAYDEMLRRAADELDPAERMVLLREAEAMLMQQQPLAPIYHYTSMDVFDPELVRNLHINMWSYRRLDRIEVLPPTGQDGLSKAGQ